MLIDYVTMMSFLIELKNEKEKKGKIQTSILGSKRL